jgi:hypothetical protein
MKNLKDLTDVEKEALTSLLYLVTHDEAVNTAIRASYGAARAGKSGMMNVPAFIATLDSLYARNCK